jgi:hypothetical protein
MNENAKKIKENAFNKIGSFFSLHPLLSSLIISFVSALYLSIIIVNFDSIISSLQLFTVTAFIIPGAFLCLVIGLYLGIVLHRKEIKESISDKDFYFRIGSVVFFYSVIKDSNLNKTYPAVIGPCCPVCGENIWAADKMENNCLIFNCRRCNSVNTVSLEEFESIKNESELTIQKAFERLKKFQDKFKDKEQIVEDNKTEK